MASAATADQLELIKDDPRREPSKSPLTIIRELKHAKETYGDLLTIPLAASVLGCSTAQVSGWLGRGRITRVEIGRCVFVPAAEIEFLYHERKAGKISQGGAGKKLPSLAEAVKLQQKATE